MLVERREYEETRSGGEEEEDEDFWQVCTILGMGDEIVAGQIWKPFEENETWIPDTEDLAKCLNEEDEGRTKMRTTDQKRKKTRNKIQ
jgi:hypothetical protein